MYQTLTYCLTGQWNCVFFFDADARNVIQDTQNLVKRNSYKKTHLKHMLTIFYKNYVNLHPCVSRPNLTTQGLLSASGIFAVEFFVMPRFGVGVFVVGSCTVGLFAVCILCRKTFCSKDFRSSCWDIPPKYILSQASFHVKQFE